ncbi:phosphoribosyl 1,2-cyclic phosphate phosphodiesterase [Roseivirga ehrenbergii]|uniref:MBL fold metallo-hydrolase n=1 Tax=Roseivirga ehrenbergii (strain DSM 102268 / JCM 13514 / KCTC 12282 / NCIMB 14502 / KMM 6017) TaxID=279360 RepID=A0A150WYQ3_ROSEK|nr:MBL fold metallo-hydrolase [Roseivirga ehrenbergii]KYG71618.1 MBL fold metallo-hydrolase [Roseivirga ehrenbergii]TCL07693.1 phosphoribosyl 1,2-cyclic phosphate phosphodiesterase [Roseivirga ehrenbergii]
MKVTFLGTGTSQGVPVIGCTCEVCRSLDFRDKRLRTSIHVEVDGLSIIFDSGPDFRQQILRENITQLDALVFTHEHKDHTAGMDDIRSFNFLQKKDMPVYARGNVVEQLKREFAYIFSENKYPGIPMVEIQEIDNSPFFIEKTKITPIEVTHFKLPVFGFRIKDFTYITDAKTISDKEKEKIRGSKTLVINALQIDEHLSHMTLNEAISLAKEINADHTYFTHLSHRMGTHKKTEKLLPENIEIAYDGLKIEI